MRARDRRFEIRLTDDEDRMLRAVSAAEGLTVSDLLRLQVRRLYRAHARGGLSEASTRPKAGGKR